jgi:hypothetical protein
MVKIIGACAAAAPVCGSLTLVSEEISQVGFGSSNAAVKGDRVDGDARAVTCSQYAWPYYDSACLYDSRRPADEVRKVRIVSIDRLPPRPSNAD